MKLHMLLVIGFAAAVVGCAEKQQAAPEQEIAKEQPPEVSEAPEVKEAPAGEPDTTFAKIEAWRDADLLDHMHAHAEQLDDLNFALDDGNLEQAMTSAYWLSRHDTVEGLPEDLRPFVDRMRDAARSVEAAEDIPAARAAAKGIAVECQGCHTNVGVVTE